MTPFIQVGNLIVHRDEISHIDLRGINDLKVIVHFSGGEQSTVVGIQAIEVVMTTKPSALESKRLRWQRHRWAIHNLVGHPLMQFLAFFKMYDLAMRVHDATVPRPEGIRPETGKPQTRR